MVLVKSPPVSKSAYLLIDDAGERICATWAHVPAHVRTGDSMIELASHVSRLAIVDFDDALSRVIALLDAGIIHRRGAVDKKVVEELRRRGARMMNIEDEAEAEPSTPPTNGEDGEDENEEL